MKRAGKLFAGEFIGTFLMVFMGVGAVATATLFGAMTGPFQVGMVWGITIAIAIYVTRHLSGAHFNPAVSVAMVVGARMSIKELPIYLIGQFCGAFCAGLLLWVIFADSVFLNMEVEGITMTQAGSASSIWCEVFPNTAMGIVPVWIGALAEGFGVFILVFVIFSMTADENLGRPNAHLAPLFIGLTVTVIIGTVGPLTDAGLNPARDIGPRLAAFMVGWSNVALSWEIIVVYTCGPLAGGIVAALLYNYIVRPMHNRCVNNTDSPCPDEAHICEIADTCDRKAQILMSEADNLD